MRYYSVRAARSVPEAADRRYGGGAFTAPGWDVDRPDPRAVTDLVGYWAWRAGAPEWDPEIDRVFRVTALRLLTELFTAAGDHVAEVDPAMPR